MYETDYRVLDYSSASESKKLESSYGISQVTAEKLVLSDCFEKEESYPMLEALIWKLSQIAETGNKEVISKICSYLRSKDPKQNKRGLFEIGLIDPSAKLINCTWLLAMALQDMS